MKPLTALFVTAAIAFLYFTAPAAGQQQQTCKPYFDAVEQLANDYSEHPTKGYVTAEGSMVVIFENAETETWTIVIVQSNGTACGAASGNGSTTTFPEIEKPGEDS